MVRPLAHWEISVHPQVKPKSKKTFNISAIVAAALKNDEVLQYSAFLPENKRKILYVDTEQSKYHCHKVMERIMRLAGLPTDKDREDFIFCRVEGMYTQQAKADNRLHAC